MFSLVCYRFSWPEIIHIVLQSLRCLRIVVHPEAYASILYTAVIIVQVRTVLFHKGFAGPHLNVSLGEGRASF